MQDALFISGSKIDIDGFKLSFDQEEKIKTLLEKTLKNIAVKNVSLKLLKNNKLFEGILWCDALGTPIGTFSRHISLSQLLDSLFRKVNREYRKVAKYSKPKPGPFKSQRRPVESTFSLSA